MKSERLRQDGHVRGRDPGEAGASSAEVTHVEGREAVPAPDAAGFQESEAVEENVETIRQWEQAALHDRSAAERLSDWITWTAASGPFLLFHVAWFTLWILANLDVFSGIRPFDPFPFPFLTMAVSLEAIFLALFVLASQNRLAHQSEKRAHLDLQIDLLAEREMTAVLQLLQDIARKLEVESTVTPEQIKDLAKKTDLYRLTAELNHMPDPGLIPRDSSPHK